MRAVTTAVLLLAAGAALACAEAPPAEHAPAPSAPTFDWSSDAYSGSFQQAVPLKDVRLVGEIPAGIYGVTVTLRSSSDADIQLRERDSGLLLIGWPSGALAGKGHECKTAGGLSICYSGYNGGGTVSTTGHETVEIRSWTRRPLVLSVYGYEAATASVTYSWRLSTRDCTMKEGVPFTASGTNGTRQLVGTVPAGTTELDVRLAAKNDLDIQVDGHDGRRLVNWVGGLLAGKAHECRTIDGVEWCYSGYNGDGNGVGHEFVTVKGKLARPVTIQSYFYRSGDAHVTYSFKQDHAECLMLGAPDPSELRFYVAGPDSYAKFGAVAGEGNFYGTDDVDFAVARLGGGFLLRHRAGTPSVPAKTKVQVKLTLLTKRNAAHASFAEITLTPTRSADAGAAEWTARLPAEMPVGRYNLTVLVNGEAQGHALPAGATLYVVFDPRAHGATDKTLLQSYVLQEDGPVWWGSASKFQSMTWFYRPAQQLDAAMRAVETINAAGGLRAEQLHQAHLLVRELTWLAGNRIMHGRWDGHYSDGAAPYTWTDSSMILDRWKATGQRVKYTQCWVFAAVSASIGRALGLATRVVTTFESAHDHQPYDLVIERRRGESVWNFHVWNEYFLAAGGYSGWWAADSTPQELSGGYFQTGPTPVKDVHDLPLGRPGSGVPASSRFDTAFVAGEVDSHYWRGGADGYRNRRAAAQAMGAHELDTTKIGRFVSTQRAGCRPSAADDCRLDLSALYRTDGARGANADAAVLSLLETRGDADEPRHFAATLRRVDARTNKTLPGAPQLGDDVVVDVRRTATPLPHGPDNQTVAVVAQFSLTEYSGNALVTLQASSGAPAPCAAGALCLSARLTAAEYAPHLFMGSSLAVRATASVANLTFEFERDLVLASPRALVTLPAGGLHRYARFRANVTVYNPLPLPMTGVAVAADTNGPEDVPTVAFDGVVVPPYGNVTVTTGDLVVSACGRVTVAVAVTTAQVSANVRGDSSIEVACNASTSRPQTPPPPLHEVDPAEVGPGSAEPHSCCGGAAPSSPCEARHLHTCPHPAEPVPPVPHDCCARANVTCPMAVVHSCASAASAAEPKRQQAPVASAPPAPAPAPASAPSSEGSGAAAKHTPAASRTAVITTSMTPVSYD